MDKPLLLCDIKVILVGSISPLRTHHTPEVSVTPRNFPPLVTQPVSSLPPSSYLCTVGVALWEVGIGVAPE